MVYALNIIVTGKERSTIKYINLMLASNIREICNSFRPTTIKYDWLRIIFLQSMTFSKMYAHVCTYVGILHPLLC